MDVKGILADTDLIGLDRFITKESGIGQASRKPEEMTCVSETLNLPRTVQNITTRVSSLCTPPYKEDKEIKEKEETKGWESCRTDLLSQRSSWGLEMKWSWGSSMIQRPR